MTTTATATAVDPAVTAAANAAVDAAAPDYASLLLGPDPDATTTTTAAATTEQQDAATLAGDAGGDTVAGAEGGEEAGAGDAAAPATTAASHAAQPGTPDKALQKLQQDLGAATRQIEALQAKVDAGATLTKAESAQAAAAQRKLGSIREALKAKGDKFDVLDHSADLAEALVETGDDVAGLKARLDAQQAELAELRQSGRAAAGASAMAELATAYPKVDIAACWDKSVADAMQLIGVDDVGQLEANPALAGALRNAANRLFHERAGAASKSVAARTAATAAAATTKKPAAAGVTPAGARVAQGSGVVPAVAPTPESKWLRNAEALVVDD